MYLLSARTVKNNSLANSINGKKVDTEEDEEEKKAQAMEADNFALDMDKAVAYLAEAYAEVKREQLEATISLFLQVNVELPFSIFEV